MTDTSQGAALSGDKPAVQDSAKPRPYWFPDTRSVLAIGTVACVFVAGFVNGVDNPKFMALLPLGTMVLTWYFGSSKSSDDKNETINKQLDKGP